MKNTLFAFIVAAVLTGCAAASYSSARSSANLVKNGMTVHEAASILGLPPSHQTAVLAQWRRGNAQEYDATPGGAIEFSVKNGIIVDVPEGGIFGAQARIKHAAAIKARWEASYAAALKKSEDDELRAKEKALSDERSSRLQTEENERRAQAAAKKLREALAAESEAAASATFLCDEKKTCSKAFALAQIYLASHVDQKIQVVTDTIIQTYNPTESGNVGGSVIKMPKRGTSALVNLSLTCKHDSIEATHLCLTKQTLTYSGFRSYIERNIK